MNTNCLAGIKCPKCGNEAVFAITAQVWCIVEDDGVIDYEDHEWDDDSIISCRACPAVGKVGAWTTEPIPA